MPRDLFEQESSQPRDLLAGKNISQMGAPVSVRASVGAAQKPADRLANLRRFYPDAAPYGEDNFIFTDPKTKLPTIYNRKGFDVGDLASIGGEASEMAGGVIGGALAVPPAVAGALPSFGTSLLTIPAGIGLGAGAGRELFNLLGVPSGQIDTRSVPNRLTDAAVTVGSNTVGARLGDLIGQAPGAIMGATRRYFRGIDPSTAIQDATRVGVELPAGAATGNRTIQIIENALSNTPGGATIMQRQAENALEAMDTASANIERRMSPVIGPQTPQGAGEILRTGSEAAGHRFAARREQLAEALDAAVSPDTMVSTPTVRALVQDLERQVAEAPASRGPVLQQALNRARAVLEDVAPTRNAQGQATSGAGVRFQTLRQIRTDLGRELERPDIAGYNPAQEAAARRLYGALSEDVNAAATAAGPDASRLLRTHDRYVRFNRNVNLPTLQRVADTQSDEAAFGFAMNAAKDGGSKLRTLRRNLTPGEWDVVASSVFHKLGRANPGQQAASGVGQAADDFSINTFVTNWSKLSPEAKISLFGGQRYNALRPEIDSLVRTAGRLKDAEKMANPSGTARNTIAALSVIGAGGQLAQGDPKAAGVTLAAGLLAPRALASLITSPRFVRWLASSVGSVQRHPNNLGARLGQLTSIAEAEPALRDGIYNYLDTLRAAPTPQRYQASE